MPTKNVAPTRLDDLNDDLINARISASNTFSVRLTPTVLTAALASDAAVTEVTGTNYTAGGIVLTVTVGGTKPVRILQSSTAMQWTKGAGAFTDAASAYIHDDTAGRILGFIDIRDGSTAIDTTADDLILTFANGTDILQLN